MSKKGKDFEIAVYEFVKSLSPKSTVYFDHTVFDKDTGTPQQVDAWIETEFADHFPLTFHVSCKDHGRKLDIGHIRTFITEVKSSGATTGIIYSRSGFYKPALKKAKSHNMACCQLYEKSPADKPELLVLNYYVCCSRVEFGISFTDILEGVNTCGDLFDQKVKDSCLNVVETIQSEATSLENEVKGRHCGFPKESSKTTKVVIKDGNELEIDITLKYRYYKGKLEAHLVSGSYCFSNGDFKGKQSSPVIDMKSVHPGEGWEEITLERELPSWKAIAILSGGKLDASQLKLKRNQKLIY